MGQSRLHYGNGYKKDFEQVTYLVVYGGLYVVDLMKSDSTVIVGGGLLHAGSRPRLTWRGSRWVQSAHQLDTFWGTWSWGLPWSLILSSCHGLKLCVTVTNNYDKLSIALFITSSVRQQWSSFTSEFHYTVMAGPRKELEAELNSSRYALQHCFYATFRFDTLALRYFNFRISCQK